MKKIATQQGQTIIEVLIALSVVMIISISFTNITLTALRNVQYAKSQEQATKIAQETLEIIRAIRDQNGTVRIRDQNGTVGNRLWEDLWSVSRTQCFNIAGDFPGYILNERDCWESANESIAPTNSSTVYRRVITISRGRNESNNPDENTKQVTVRVYWQDSKGTHSAEVNTLLTRWN
jgi:type IV pilus modification protein PilV